MASTIIMHNPRNPDTLRNDPILFSFMTFLSLAIKNMAIPIMGTMKIVILWAKTINSNGALPKRSAMIAPTVITIAISNLVLLELKLSPNPSASLIKVPPMVALPTTEENPAANSPIKNTAEAASPKAGRSASDISVAVFTSTPNG